jgi:hypothetical protein
VPILFPRFGTVKDAHLYHSLTARHGNANNHRRETGGIHGGQGGTGARGRRRARLRAHRRPSLHGGARPARAGRCGLFDGRHHRRAARGRFPGRADRGDVRRARPHGPARPQQHGRAHRRQGGDAAPGEAPAAELRGSQDPAGRHHRGRAARPPGGSQPRQAPARAPRHQRAAGRLRRGEARRARSHRRESPQQPPGGRDPHHDAGTRGGGGYRRPGGPAADVRGRAYAVGKGAHTPQARQAAPDLRDADEVDRHPAGAGDVDAALAQSAGSADPPSARSRPQDRGLQPHGRSGAGGLPGGRGQAGRGRSRLETQ